MDGSNNEDWTRLRGRLWSYLARLTGDRWAAEDLCQETFVVVQTRSEQFRQECSYETWVFTIGSRLALDHLRRATTLRRVQRQLAGWLRGAAPADEDGALQRTLGKQILQQLKPASRQVLLLQGYLGLSYAEIGKVLELTPTHVGVLLNRARAEALQVARRLGIER